MRNVPLDLEICDTNEKNRGYFLKSADVILLCFSYESRASFEHLFTLKKDIDALCKRYIKPKILLIGLCADVLGTDKQAVSAKDTISVAEHFQVDASLDCSARNYSNVYEVFELATRKYYHSWKIRLALILVFSILLFLALVLGLTLGLVLPLCLE